MNELAIKETIGDVIEVKDRLIERLAAATAEVRKIRNELQRYDADLAESDLQNTVRTYQTLNTEAADEKCATFIRIAVDMRVWRWLVGKTHLGQFMTEEQRRQFDDTFCCHLPRVSGWQDVKFVPLTQDTALATLLKLAASSWDNTEDAVVDLFQNASKKHKTNDGFKFGKKMIYCRIQGYIGIIDAHMVEKLYEFQRVVDIMEDRMPPENPYVSPLYAVVRDAFNKGELEAETESIKVRLFKNGNAHMFIKNQSTCDRMNAIVARKLGGHVLGK